MVILVFGTESGIGIVVPFPLGIILPVPIDYSG